MVSKQRFEAFLKTSKAYEHSKGAIQVICSPYLFIKKFKLIWAFYLAIVQKGGIWGSDGRNKSDLDERQAR